METSSQENLLEEANTGYINALHYLLLRMTEQNTHETSVCAIFWAVCRWDLNIDSSLR